MARAVDDRLLDIRAAAVDLLAFVANIEESLFHDLEHRDRMAFRAIKNAIAEMGEAIKTLPDDICARHPEVDWRGFAGLRDVVTHQYFGVDMEQLVSIIKYEAPGLLDAINAEIAVFPNRSAGQE